MQRLAAAELHNNIRTIEAHEFALAEHVVDHEVAGVDALLAAPLGFGRVVSARVVNGG